MGFRIVGGLYGSTHENEAMFGRALCERTGPDRLVGPFQKILVEDHIYYNHYAIESAFKKAMNLDKMAVVHFAISACK
jgi:hypothetical protein